MKDRQAIVDYGFEHATSLRGKYTRKGRFLCNMYTLVGYAKPSVGPPNYSNGSGGAIPSPKLAIQQPFYACLCLTMPILRYDWNSGFHTLAPATCSFAESTCLFYPRRYVGRSKMHMSSQIVHITSAKKTNHENIVLPKKNVKSHKSSQLPIILPETLSKQFTLVGTKCLLNSQRVLAEALFPEKLCSSQPRFTTSTLCHY